MSKEIDLISVEGSSSLFIDKKNNITYKIILEPVKDFKNIIIQDNILTNDKYKRYKIEVITDGFMGITHLGNEQLEVSKRYKILLETPDIYDQLLPTIEKSDKIWIYNIIDKKEEMDRILFENDFFIILPDFKWNNNINDLYLLLIVKDKTLKSIRDLRETHILMLLDMIKCISCLLKDKYVMDIADVRMYFHYRPSVWHLHLHINNINSTNVFSSSIERAHSIINIINNLQCNGNYYRDALLEVVV